MAQDTIRITTWNCRSGPACSRLEELVRFGTDIACLQECSPEPGLPLAGEVLLHDVGGRKGMALASPSGTFALTRLVRPEAPGPSIAAIAEGPMRLLVLGLWTHGPDYRVEIDQIVDVFGDLIDVMPTVLLGDLNTGPRLGNTYIKGGAVFDRLAARGLRSAYHAHHGVAHGLEQHATYFHLRKADNPWHIDYCLVSRDLVPRILAVDVGDHADWTEHSDHCPVTVTLSVEERPEPV